MDPIDLLNPKYSFIGAHRWEPDRRTTVYIFDKKTGELVRPHRAAKAADGALFYKGKQISAAKS